MRDMRHQSVLVVILAAAVSVGAARPVAAQQSARGTFDPVPTSRADRARAESATAQTCLTASAQAAQALNSAGESRRGRWSPGSLGHGGLDASEGMSRPPLEPQLHIIEGVDASQRGQRSFLNATRVRNQQATHCTPVPAKPVALPTKPDSTK